MPWKRSKTKIFLSKPIEFQTRFISHICEICYKIVDWNWEIRFCAMKECGKSPEKWSGCFNRNKYVCNQINCINRELIRCIFIRRDILFKKNTNYIWNILAISQQFQCADHTAASAVKTRGRVLHHLLVLNLSRFISRRIHSPDDRWKR